MRSSRSWEGAHRALSIGEITAHLATTGPYTRRPDFVPAAFIPAAQQNIAIRGSHQDCSFPGDNGVDILEQLCFFLGYLSDNTHRQPGPGKGWRSINSDPQLFAYQAHLVLIRFPYWLTSLKPSSFGSPYVMVRFNPRFYSWPLSTVGRIVPRLSRSSPIGACSLKTLTNSAR